MDLSHFNDVVTDFINFMSYAVDVVNIVNMQVKGEKLASYTCIKKATRKRIDEVKKSFPPSLIKASLDLQCCQHLLIFVLIQLSKI